MKNICFIFPGQGSQKAGMAKELVKISSSAKKVFNIAQDVLGFDLLDICQNADQELLNNTRYCQPAIVATSLAAYEILKENDILPNAVLGHSLGQYSALFAAGVFSLKDTFRLIKIRAAAMQKACDAKKGAMYAILGSDKKTIKQACKNADGYVICSNYNSPSQIVISGELKAVEQAAISLKNIAKRCIKLKTSGAFHSDLMKPAAEYFKKNIENIKFSSAATTIYSNVTSNPIKDAKEIKNLLIEHFTAPLLFEKSIVNITKDLDPVFIELGQGKVLSGFLKDILKDPVILNLQDSRSFLNVMNFFGKNLDLIF